MNPNIKLVVMLRDPVQRALSRFMEQKFLTFGPCHKENETFEGYVAKELDRLKRCRETAAGYGSQQGQAQQPPPAGWGAGYDLGAWMTAQCAAQSNILGWSMYDVFLENYLAHFRQEQVLVLYTDDLAAEPLTAIRRVEAFLGVAAGNYSFEELGLVYNSRGCYSWQCAKKKVEVRGLSVAGGGGSGPSIPLGDGGNGDGGGLHHHHHQQQQQQQQQDQQPQPRDGPFLQAVSQLVELYRPHMQRLFAWADQGRIAPPPPVWRGRYDIS
ncbi:hypothetical protein PLESTM_000540800 [Pleodorina starrii]|nr:hypothetical protein PLESTM_000540800 [Pleodorina starrii]